MTVGPPGFQSSAHAATVILMSGLGAWSLLVGAGLAAAQAPGPQTATIVGLVVDSAGRAVSGATVYVDGRVPVETGIGGRFRFDSLAPGTHTVRVRSIGFAPFSATIRLAAGTADARVTLSTSTYRLPEIVVRTRSSRLEETGFYQRQTEFLRGRFLEGDSLIRLDSLSLPLALSRITGLRLKSVAALDSGVASTACRGGFRLWLNGWDISDGTDNAFYLRTIKPDEVAGVEIYEDGTPPLVFTRHVPKPCVVAIWER